MANESGWSDYHSNSTTYLLGTQVSDDGEMMVLSIGKSLEMVESADAGTEILARFSDR